MMGKTPQDWRGQGWDLSKIPVYRYNTVVVGSGAAGLNSADQLYRLGQRDVAVVTEDMLAGTSRNAGSDKQTYYKLSLSGGEPDSIRAMAQVLYDGQCMDGDHALCEAAGSVPAFFKLVELGVPFPQDRYGEFVGYKTDHDPGCRATSAGPYTSKTMVECLQRAVEEKKIPVHDHMQAVKILVKAGRAYGLLAFDVETVGYVLFSCRNMILATGGPAGMYRDSVYPLGHHGATGIAFEAGARGKNLTEWQCGMASIKPRWNVSGTYMQVLPRFVSTEPDGSDEREFLADCFPDRGTMLSMIFLKGYQWPFDVRKAMDGSSVIDLLVYQESCIKGRRVFLDYTQNPGGQAIDFEGLEEEARCYLEKAGACFGTPIERLLHMNPPAVALYRDKGVDLTREKLEIAVCVQHNNGGLAVDTWWETNVKGLFAVGEVSGTHGVYRPGGTALNAGQVGAMRAARYIAARCRGEAMEAEAFRESIREEIWAFAQIGEGALEAGAVRAAEVDADVRTDGREGRLTREGGSVRESEAIREGLPEQQGEADSLSAIWERATGRMSRTGSIIRDVRQVWEAREAIQKELAGFRQDIRIKDRIQIPQLYCLRETLICQYVYLSAMEDYGISKRGSRGSALYTDENGRLPQILQDEQFRFSLDQGEGKEQIQEVVYKEGQCEIHWRKRREIPADDGFFENVWRGFREDGNIVEDGERREGRDGTDSECRLHKD